MRIKRLWGRSWIPSISLPWNHVYCGVLFVVVLGAWSPIAMAIVFVWLMSMVVMLLYVDMSLCSFLECLFQSGMTAAVSSANVLMWACGSVLFIIPSKLSVAMANMSGDRGHP